MCITDIYPYVEADGSQGETRETRRCTSYRRREPCDPVIYRHPRRSAAIPIPPARTPAHLPPSPRLTPGSSFPSPRMHQGTSPRRPMTPYESDSEGSQRRRRPSIYVNGQRVAMSEVISASSPHRRSRSYEAVYETPGRRDREQQQPRGGRVVIVEGPPTPRSPPVNYAIPRTAPASPSFPNGILADPLRHRPVVVDEREQQAGRRTVRIEVPQSPAASESSSSGSRHRRAQRQQQWQYGDDGRGERRREGSRDRERGEAEEEARRRRAEARIAEANRKIAERTAQPVPPRRSATTYVRPTVEVRTPVGLGVSGEQLVEGMRGLGVREAEEGEEEEEEEARRQRLRERMLPRRRASIGPGSRRVRVEYGDGMYRLE